MAQWGGRCRGSCGCSTSTAAARARLQQRWPQSKAKQSSRKAKQSSRKQSKAKQPQSKAKQPQSKAKQSSRKANGNEAQRAPVSLPRAKCTAPMATAEAEPLEEPARSPRSHQISGDAGFTYLFIYIYIYLFVWAPQCFRNARRAPALLARTSYCRVCTGYAGDTTVCRSRARGCERGAAPTVRRRYQRGAAENAEGDFLGFRVRGSSPQTRRQGCSWGPPGSAACRSAHSPH